MSSVFELRPQAMDHEAQPASRTAFPRIFLHIRPFAKIGGPGERQDIVIEGARSHAIAATARTRHAARNQQETECEEHRNPHRLFSITSREAVDRLIAKMDWTGSWARHAATRQSSVGQTIVFCGLPGCAAAAGASRQESLYHLKIRVQLHT